MTTITASFTYAIYESNDKSFSVCEYRDCSSDKKFRAIGEQLPKIKSLPMNLVGDWEVNHRSGEKQFRVQYAEKGTPNRKDEIVAYLTSLKCGIGKRKAEMIYAQFGDKTWETVETSPDSLICVFGMSKKGIEKLKVALATDNKARDLIKMFSHASLTVSGNIVHNMIQFFGEDVVSIIRNNPYAGCKIRGFDFAKADILAANLGFPKNNPNRLKAATHSVLNAAAHSGHVCVPYDVLIPEIVRFTDCTQEECVAAIKDLFRCKELRFANNCIYTAERFEQESTIATELVRLLNSDNCPITQVDAFIDDYEKANFTLAESQKEAVRNVFRHNVSIITGGPGVGKTTVTKAILATHLGVFGASSEPVLLAPTGKAARRMSEATGYPAQTIHSAIGWIGDDMPCSDEMLEGNLFIIDEVSMMDQMIASYLLKCIPTGSRVVFVGDIDQLPSVGCGDVLNDMIQGGIPTTRLTVIFRQAAENPIVANCHAINEGNTELKLDKNFIFVETKNEEEIFKCACMFYEKVVKKYGMEKVILLNPQRRNTNVSVDRFNQELQARLNPQDGTKKEIVVGKTTFRNGDKVIELKNTEFAKNGDTGYIIDITKRANDPENPRDFDLYAIIEWNGDGNAVEYNVDDLKHVDLAYCMTVHKSQGSEYQTVIEIVSRAHPAFLKRNLVYTGISRARVNCVVIGEMEAMKAAIHCANKDVRYTHLREQIAVKLKNNNI